MPVVPESWDPIVKTLGYENEKAMLEDLYVKQNLSIGMLVKKLGYSQNNLRRRLALHKIPIRKRGGVNFQKISNLSDEQLGGDTKTLAVQFDVHPSTIWKERRKRNLCTSASSPQSSTDSTSSQSGASTTSSSRISSRERRALIGTITDAAKFLEKQ